VRRIIESTLLSLDGVIGDPHIWASERFDQEARDGALAQLRVSGGMLMGRRTYEIFSGLWPRQSGDYADAINGIRKYVFSSTLENPEWSNTTVIRGDVAVEAERLKREDGGDLVMYGHGPVGETLLEHGLLDELSFAVYPLFVGHGTPLRRDGAIATLELVATRTLGTGVVVLTYAPAG
jgi:dihydrofolate reductase